MPPPILSEEMKAFGARLEVVLASELVERLEAEDGELVSATTEVLRTLFCGARTISASLLGPAIRGVGFGGELALISVSITSNADGLPDHAPSLVKLGKGSATAAEAQADALSVGAYGAWSPTLIAGPATSGGLSGVRYELDGGSWQLLADGLAGAGSSAELCTWGQEVGRFVRDGSPVAYTSGAEPPPAAHAVLSRLWGAGGPLSRLAASGKPGGGGGGGSGGGGSGGGGSGGGGSGSALDCRGEGGWACRLLSSICYELSQQLLPGLKDGRRAAVAADLHQPLVKELTRLLGLKDGAPKAPDGKKILWGAEPSWFEDSILSELACDSAGSEALLEALKPLAQLSGPATAKLEAGSPLAWLSKWRPRVAPCHGQLRAHALLVDTKRAGGCWMARAVGCIGRSAASQPSSASSSSAASDAPPAPDGTLWDDAAALCASVVVECFDVNGDGHDDDALIADLHVAIEAAVPVAGGDRLWAERRAPLGASPRLRRLLKLLSALMLEATRHAAASAASPADLHPASWLAPLLVHALSLCRVPELPDARKRLAWRLATRAASALAAELQRAPDPDMYAPPLSATAAAASGGGGGGEGSDATAGDAAFASLLEWLRASSPVGDTRLNLSCCQPLALNADAASGESARLAYIDPEGALATTTGGRFGQEFDDILASFRYDDLAPVHLRAHVAPTAFDEVSEYDSAFTAVSSLFQSLNPRLLKLKPKCGDLAALLFVAVSPKADQLAAAVTADLVEALKTEAETDVAMACATLAEAVRETRAWCCAQPKGTEKKAKIEATERLAAGLVRIAHELSVTKSRQGDAIFGNCRAPRFDCGQRVSFLDRSQPGKQAWRDATVLHGGPMLCEIDGEGRVLVWGARAEALTGVGSAQARASADWVEALLTGMDDMMDHARLVSRGVVSGEAKNGKGEDRLFESVCMPFNTTGGRPMVVAPVLIRAAATGGCTSSMAKAIVVEAGTDLHLLQTDAEGGSVGGGGQGGGGQGASKPAEVRLEPLNHAPLSLAAAALELELAAFLADVQVRHGSIRDALGRLVAPYALSLGPPPHAAGSSGGSAASASAAALAGTAGTAAGFGGGAADWGGVVDAKSLVETALLHYRTNVMNEDCAKRLAIACLVLAPPGHGKTTLAGQLAFHTCGLFAKAGALGLVPLVIPAVHLGRLMRSHPRVFAGKWNLAEAYSSLVFGAASARHAMLRQLLICRRVLLIVDGIDEGGVTSDGAEGRSLPTIPSHVLEELVLQGHPVVATARSEEVLLQSSVTGAGAAGSAGSAGARTAVATAGASTAASTAPGSESAPAVQAAVQTSGLWGRLAIKPLSDKQQREFLSQRLGPIDAKRLEPACHRLLDSGLLPLSRTAAGSPLMLSAALAVCQRAPATTEGQPASGAAEAAGGLPTTPAAFMGAALDALLSRVDAMDRASPPDAAFVQAQRALLEALGLLAHCNAQPLGAVSEAELLSHIEGRGELVTAWQLMRRKLARGTLPPLCVLSAKPLVVCVAQPCMQVYLATSAICHGRWPANMPRLWAWSEWWRGVARLGCEEVALREGFGAALLAACKAQDVPIEHITGHPPTVSDAVLAMAAQANAAGGGGGLRVKAGSHKDVLAAASAPDEHGPCPAGDLRLGGFELGALPVAGLEVLISLCAAKEGITALNLNSNGLGPSHALAVVEGAARGGRSHIDRLGLERNGLGSEGCARLCEALLHASCARITELDLSRNDIGPEAARPLCDLLRAGRVRRLVLTSNPICGGSAVGEFGDDHYRGRPGRPPPPQAVAAAAAAAAAPPTDSQNEAARALASAVGACTSLHELQMRAVGLDAAAGVALGEAIGANRSLQILSLWKNGLGGRGGKALVQGLRMNATLTLLDLRSNKLDDEAGLAIASHLATARGSKLSQLLVSDNDLGPESGKAIAKAWADNATLFLLDVRGNKLDAAAVKELKSARGSAARKRSGREGAEPVELLADE